MRRYRGRNLVLDFHREKRRGIKIRKKETLLALVTIAVICIASVQYSIATSSNASSQKVAPAIHMSPLEPLATIHIGGDSDLNGANGVRNPSAAGTKNDPYIIANWIIDAEHLEPTCIEINNTRAYLEIRDCILENATIGILIENATNIKIINVTIAHVRGLNGLDGSDGADDSIIFPGTPGSPGGKGGEAYGIIARHSKGIVMQGNTITDIIGGKGGKGGRGGNGMTGGLGASPGFQGGDGGIGEKASGIAFEQCVNVICSGNTINSVKGGDGGSGGKGGQGSSGILSVPGQAGGQAGEGGPGDLSAGISSLYSVDVEITGNNVSAILGGTGGAGGNGGNGGNGYMTAPNGGPGGPGGNGADGGSGGIGQGLYFCDNSYMSTLENVISNISGGTGGKGGDGGNGGNGGPGLFGNAPGGNGGNGLNGGSGGLGIGVSLEATFEVTIIGSALSSIYYGSGGQNGSKGIGGNDALNGVDGNIGADGQVNGLMIHQATHSLIYLNLFLCENIKDDGNYNNWDNGSMGNCWQDYDGVDANDDGIGDEPYSVAGSAGSKDNYPIFEDTDDVAPIIALNDPKAQLFYGAAAPSYSISVVERYLSHIWYSLDEGSTNVSVSAFTGELNQLLWNNLQDGPVHVKFYVNDSAGRISYDSTTIYRDVTAPTVVISFTPSEGTNIVNRTTLFTLDANDGAGCGVQVSKYSINGTTWIDYNGSFNLSMYADGNYIVSYYAVDNLGNTGQVNSVVVTIEAEGPIYGEPVESPILLITALAGIAVVGLVVVVYLVRRPR